MDSILDAFRMFIGFWGMLFVMLEDMFTGWFK